MDFDKRRIEALTSRPAKDDARFMVVALVLAAAIFEADLMLPLGMALWVPYVSLALLSVWSRHRKSVFILATICTGFIILGFVYSPLRFSLKIDLFNRSVGVLVIWVIAILSVQRVQAEEELRKASNKLEIRVNERTAELANVVETLLAIENSRLFDEIRCNLERVQALREIDEAITSTLDLDTVLDVLMEKIDLILPSSATTVGLFDKEKRLLEPVACRNLDEKEWKGEIWRSGYGPANVVFETNAPIMVRNIQSDPLIRVPNFFRKRGLVSYLAVPMVIKDEVLGVLSVYTKQEHEFNNTEIEFLSALAGQAAIAIHNSQLYEQSKKQAVELDRASRVKDEFLSVMSHELRTPLNVVMGYAGMMKDRLLGELSLEQEKSLEKIVSRARDQIKLINRILQATQLETGVVKVERHEINLSHFLDEFRLTYEAPLDKELALYWDYPCDLLVVKTDGEKLEHVLENVINNAIKFTEKGYVTVSARIKEGSSQQAEVEFKVADTGIGIREEALPFIFERFHQGDSSETRPYGGVGLGLYIVKKFTELLGGKVEVESEVGKGSTFTVTIPCEMYSPMVGQQTHGAENREPNA